MYVKWAKVRMISNYPHHPIKTIIDRNFLKTELHTFMLAYAGYVDFAIKNGDD